MGGSARAHEAAIGNIKVVKKVDKIIYDLINLYKSYTCEILWCPGEAIELYI